MIDDIQREQAALYALDALPADEAAKFRAQVRANPALAEIVAEYEASGLLFAQTAPSATPPPALRGRILAAIAPPSAASPGASRPVSWLPWGIAAALILTTGALWLQNQRLSDDKAALALEADGMKSLRVEYARLQTADAEKTKLAATLRDRIDTLEHRTALAETQVATLTSKLDASYLASIAWDNSAQEGILKVRRLPAAERGKDYQLWVISPDNAAPVSGGVFTVAEDGSATIRFSPAQKVSAATAFAVSMEKTGGSASPEGPIVLSN